jgi:DNA-binding NarL/FixJ family response regulator
MNTGEKSQAYHMKFCLSREDGEMQLLGMYPTLQSFSWNSGPISPGVKALKLITQSDGQMHRFLADVCCDEAFLQVTFSCDNNAAACAPRELLEQALRQQLTPREIEAAVLLFQGCTIRAAATEMTIAEGTVKRMTHNIYQKMGVACQVELIREIYARLGYGQTNS